MTADLHSRLRQARQNAGYLSAAAAAEKLDLPYSTYASHENGWTGYGAANAQAYSSLFGVAVEWLLYGTGDDAGQIDAGQLQRIEAKLDLLMIHLGVKGHADDRT